jgi:hypothetical protein
MGEVPRVLADLTDEWLTTALQRRWPGAVVAKHDLGEVEDGTNRRAAIQLAYRDGDGPASVFVKIHGRPMHRLALIALGALPAEARLAASGVDLPITRPEPVFAAVDRSRLRTIVVMDDITAAGGRPNDALASLSVDEVSSGLDGMAALHAAYWDRPLPGELAFLRPWRLKARWAPISYATLSRAVGILRRIGAADALSSGVTARMLEPQYRRCATLAASGPLTVLHGDPHPGNTYALAGSRTGFYDWQLARTGHWSHDVGYFIAGSLDVEPRRAHERDLLRGYLDALGTHGVTAPSFDAAWERYRATPAYGLCTWMHTLAGGSFQPQDVSVATIRRFATAYDDLDTASSLVGA